MKSKLLLVIFILISNIAFGRFEPQIQQYVDNLKTFKASFLQYNPDGSISSGVLYISKPKYVRLEYYKPYQVIINVNGPFATYYDKELDHAINIPMTNNLFNALRGNYKNVNHNLYYENKKAYLEIDDKENGKIIFKFNVKPLEIEGLDLSNNGSNIEVSFADINYNSPINNKLFYSFD
ncbi:MAG: outer membrane lipoprotein carrier protein LolA [Rickettsiaceae bacterium H1]|nr:outer membrane lipoprotein carrier protein LolA [Rickettsiaceae bacterium H1]